MKKMYKELGRLLVVKHQLQLGLDRLNDLAENAKIVFGLESSDNYHIYLKEQISKTLEMMNDMIVNFTNEIEEEG